MRGIISISCFVFVIAVATELPSYIPRCSLSDKHLSYCLVDVANTVIPYIVQGDKELGIPVLNPAYFPKTRLGGKDLNITLTDAYTFDLKNIRLTNASFNLDKKKASFDGIIDIITTFADYSISNGKVLSRSVSGHGKLFITGVGSTIRYDVELHPYEKDGEMYVDFLNATLNSTTNRSYYEFSGLHSAENDQDIDEYIRENWRAIYVETKPSLENHLVYLIQSVLVPLSKKFPINKIFAP